MTRLAKNHDAPTLARTGENYIPPRAFDPVEIERRQAQTGLDVLIIEQQRLGIDVVLQMLQMIEDPNERARAAKIIGGTMLSTAQELFDDDINIRMRHTLKLPQIADLEGWREDPDEYDRKALESLALAAESSTVLADARREKHATTKMTLDAARDIGNAGLYLAMLPLPTLAKQSSARDLQLIVRETALDMQSNVINLGDRVGTTPTIAQFANPYSPLVVDLHRNQSQEIVEATQQALALAN